MLVGMFVCLSNSNSNNRAGFLQLVVDELKGKLRPAGKDDDAILEALEKAVHTGKRHHERTLYIQPFPSEVSEAYDALPKRRQGRTGKDTKPLTAEEKKTIRDLEWSGFPHAIIEDEIGKSYKRTDNGEPVAVNENGGAMPALTKPTKDKDYLRDRLKILGWLLTDKPGAPRKSP
jgi:hypothetical protein